MRSTLSDLHRLAWTAFMAALIAAGALAHLAIGPVPITFQDMAVILAGLILGPRHGVYAMALYLFAGAAGLPVFSGGRSGLGHLAGPTGGYFAGFLLLAFWAGVGGRLAGRMLQRSHAAPGMENMPTGAHESAAPGNPVSGEQPDIPPAHAETSYPAQSANASRIPPPSRPVPLAAGKRTAPARSTLVALLCAFGCALVGMALVYACGAAWLVLGLDFSLKQAVAAGVVPFLPLGLVKTVLAVLIWQRLLQRKLLPE